MSELDLSHPRGKVISAGLNVPLCPHGTTRHEVRCSDRQCQEILTLLAGVARACSR